MSKKLASLVLEVKEILKDDNNGHVVEVKAASKEDMDYIKKELKDYSIIGITSISTNGSMDKKYVLHVKNNYGGQKNA